MLTITSEIERKVRKPSGALQFVLTPVAQQVALSNEGAGADLDRTFITICNASWAEEHLRGEALLKARGGATEITAQSLGALYINVFVPDAGGDRILSDLVQALLSQHLLVALTLGSELLPSDGSFFRGWLGGERHSEDITIWSDRIPEIGWVQPR
jgi:hypothetical protein